MSSTTKQCATSAAIAALSAVLLPSFGTSAWANPGDTEVASVAPQKAPAKSAGRTANNSGQAIARYSKVLAKNPNDANALTGRAKAYVSRRDYALALADYDRAVRIAPKSNATRYERDAVRLLLQDQSRLLAAKPAQTDAALDGSQFDGDGTVRTHIAPPVPALAKN